MSDLGGRREESCESGSRYCGPEKKRSFATEKSRRMPPKDGDASYRVCGRLYLRKYSDEAIPVDPAPTIERFSECSLGILAVPRWIVGND